MEYKNVTPRCPHGFWIGVIRCEACSGKWNDGGKGNVEPRKHGSHLAERKSPRRLLLAGQSEERSRRRELECRVPSSYRKAP